MEAVKCPKCNVTMREREKGDIIIDICPQCRGVWLDAGELEKLSVRESRYYDDDDDDGWDRPWARRGDDRERDRYEQERRYDQSRRGSYTAPRKKKGFLQTMLENFGEGGADD